MVPIDFHKYAKTRAAQPASGSLSGADMFLAISIRRTTLSFAWKHQTTENCDRRAVARDLLVSDA
jgi:hypothetical protein